MRHLDLFSGIGGFALAAKWVGWETVGFCEIDPWCRKVLRKHWPDVPIYEDVRELNGETVGSIDIITGGYPCQPFSVAGKRRGEEDDRHLWPEFARIISEAKPQYVVCENVAGHISMGLDDVLSDLEGLGYTWEAFVIPACAVDAKHRRDRVWIVAYAHGNRRSNDGQGQGGREGATLGSTIAPCEQRGHSVRESNCNSRHIEDRGALEQGRAAPLAHTDGTLSQGNQRTERSGKERANNIEHCRWPTEPDICRVAHGIPRRVDRLKGLGNAIVPQVAEVIFRAIDQQ